MTRQIIIKSLALAALIVSSTSCGGNLRNGRSPVFLVIDNLRATQGMSSTGTFQDVLYSDVRTTSGTIFADLGRVSMHASVKDIGFEDQAPVPTNNTQVSINRFRVVYRRTDGHNTPGVDVPYPYDGAVSGVLPANAIRSFDFELVKHTAKAETPLVELVYTFNIIHCIADVTFWGYDQVGNVLSVTGSISIEFANYGDSD